MRDPTRNRRRHVLFDVAIAVFFVVLDTSLTLVGSSWWPAHPDTLAWALLVLQALACFSLAARRRWPITVIAVLAGFTLLVTLLVWPVGALTPLHDQNVWAPFATVLAAYAPVQCLRPGSEVDRRRALIAIVVLTVIVARPWQPSITVITIGVLRTAAGPLVAVYFEARRRLVRALTERAERAERERHLLAEQARADERARLAGEMHDVVTHRVSLMVLQAGALRMGTTDAATREAAEELRAAGCRALDELRDLVGILRTSAGDDEEPEESHPAASALADLAAESTAVGTPTELIEYGDPGLASPVVGRTAYRIVREALTNVRKHAPGAKVTVQAHYDASQVRLTVRNSPPTRPADVALVDTGSGMGIASLRKRIELVRGTLHAGPDPAGGFCVEATLPAYVPTAESVRG